MSNSRLFAKLNKLPASITKNIIDFTDCKRKSDNKSCVRCTLDRQLTDVEKEVLNEFKFIAHIGTCEYRYASKIKHSYFYIV